MSRSSSQGKSLEGAAYRVIPATNDTSQKADAWTHKHFHSGGTSNQQTVSEPSWDVFLSFTAAPRR